MVVNNIYQFSENMVDLEMFISFLEFHNYELPYL